VHIRRTPRKSSFRKVFVGALGGNYLMEPYIHHRYIHRKTAVCVSSRSRFFFPNLQHPGALRYVLNGPVGDDCAPGADQVWSVCVPRPRPLTPWCALTSPWHPVASLFRIAPPFLGPSAQIGDFFCFGALPARVLGAAVRHLQNKKKHPSRLVVRTSFQNRSYKSLGFGTGRPGTLSAPGLLLAVRPFVTRLAWLPALLRLEK